MITRADIAPNRDMIVDVRKQVQKMFPAGKSVQEVLAAKLTSPYDSKVPGGC